MNRLLFSFASMLILFLAACTTTRLSTAARGVLAPVSVEEVKELEQQWVTALVARDTATLSRILAPGFALHGSNGKETRQQYLQTTAMPDRTLEPLVLSDREFAVFGATVVASGKTEYTGTWKKTSFRLPVRYSHVFVRSQGGWQAVAAHLTVVR